MTSMKKIIIICLAAFVTLSAMAENRAVERTYISTDKQVYVAGDAVWCSAFCWDSAAGHLSRLSSVVYLELHSPDGMVQSAKLAMIDGRGAGSFRLSSTLPTGNYKLIAYTSQNQNELSYKFDNVATKIISVYNVFTKERIKNGVEVVSDQEYTKQLASSDEEASQGLEISVKDDLRISLLEGSKATVSVSIYHEDGILPAQKPSICAFAQSLKLQEMPQMTYSVLPDFEGEVINAKVVGLKEENIPSVVGKFAFIAYPGGKSDIYSAPINESGRLRFITSNIYGDKDLVCEIEDIDSTSAVHFEIESPFVEPKLSAAPVLKMNPLHLRPLVERGTAMQIERRFASDTLLSTLEFRENMLFDSKCVTYNLDDYTRFPTMSEVIVEFVSEIRERRGPTGRREIQVRNQDNYRNHEFSYGSALMLLDGVPVFDHGKMLSYDPSLIQYIQIYPYTYYVGSRLYEGVVNFVTYKRNLPSMKFNNSVRIVSYQGVSFPEAYTCNSIIGTDDYPDYRQTIYWHPMVELSPDEQTVIKFKTPSYKGKFSVVVEGLTEDGKAVYKKISFEK